VDDDDDAYYGGGDDAVPLADGVVMILTVDDCVCDGND
jgi:hypothetical protein